MRGFSSSRQTYDQQKMSTCPVSVTGAGASGVSVEEITLRVF